MRASVFGFPTSPTGSRPSLLSKWLLELLSGCALHWLQHGTGYLPRRYPYPRCSNCVPARAPGDCRGDSRSGTDGPTLTDRTAVAKVPRMALARLDRTVKP